MAFEFRILTSQEAYTIQGNCESYTKLLHSLPKNCANPVCRLPLGQANNYELVVFGEVCNLCYHLYHAVADRQHFNRAHQVWKLKMGRMAREARDRRRDEDEDDD